MISTQVNSPVVSVFKNLASLMQLILFITLVAWVPHCFAEDDNGIPDIGQDEQQAWLVTFGPGENYWERFGHNAIWLREPAAGLDHTFNFGFFDFNQEDFFLRFMRGRMLYFSVAQRAENEFDYYRSVNRSIRIQKLNISTQQYEKLRDYLVTEIRPENRDYRYDYYLNNCSTRIRDAIDIALDGGLSERTRIAPAELNFRDHTRRLTEGQFWYYLGLELALGRPVDREVSRWDEMFIPMVVANELALMSEAGIGPGGELISVDRVLFNATSVKPANAPSSIWHHYLLLGLMVVGIAWLSGKFMPPVWLAGLCSAWVLMCAINGIVLACLWFLTDHEVARNNANLLLFNPLFILALIPSLRRLGALLLLAGFVIAVMLLVWPSHQYNLDVLALLAPVNLAVAGYFWGFQKLMSKNPLKAA